MMRFIQKNPKPKKILNLTTGSEINSNPITKEKNKKFSLGTCRRNRKFSLEILRKNREIFLKKFKKGFIEKQNKAKSMGGRPW